MAVPLIPPTPAATIDGAIASGARNIQFMTDSPVRSLQLQMNLWVNGIFASGIFPPDPALNMRVVTDWQSPSLIALQTIPGPAPGAATQEDADRCREVVWNLCSAVKFAEAPAGPLTPAQVAAVVAAFNVAWL